jgi:Tol biopolymer transport system component
MMVLRRQGFLCLWLLPLLFFVNAGAEVSLPALNGPLLGQKAPGEIPKLFAPEFVSTVLYTRDAALSPDGNEFYYSVFTGSGAHIVMTTLEGGQWSAPKEVFTSPMYQECEPTLSADGSRLMFLCNGDPAGGEAQRGWRFQNIWASDREGQGWGAPYCLPAPVNDSTAFSYYPSLAGSGSLYFTRQAADRSTAIYCSHYIDGDFAPPERLGEGVNSTTHQFNACIAPDESYLVFCSMERDTNIGRIDYYVSFRENDGRFGEAINLGLSINSEDNNVGAPAISPDGRYFFFASTVGGMTPAVQQEGFRFDRLLQMHNSPQNGSSNIFWIETTQITALRNQRRREDSDTDHQVAETTVFTPSESKVWESDSTELPEGDYLGQPLPGDEPQLFAPGVVSTGMCTRDVAMTPDGNEIYFCVHAPDFSYSTIVLAKRENQKWGRPEVAPFATDAAFNCMEPFISSDGNRFYYISARIDEAHPEIEENSDIYVMERKGKGWGEARRMVAPITSSSPEFFPSFTKEGTIYFTRADPVTGRHDIYRARPDGDSFLEPELLGPEVNAGRSQFNAFISPDERYLITCAVGIPETIGSVDYYVCFRSEDDTWTGPINLGDKVNTLSGREYSPYVSPDGRFFFFMSSRTDDDETAAGEGISITELIKAHRYPRNGNPDIYWMTADFIEALRPE